MLEHPLPSIPGYILTTQLYSGRRTTVYRAIDEHNGTSVVLKVLRRPSLTINELTRFRNQFIIAKNLGSPNILTPLALVPWNNSYALVMEDVGGMALQDYLKNHNPLSVAQSLDIGLQLADSLHHLSQNRILHKDINPANILIHPDTHQIWLMDFSLASLLPKENQQLKSPHALEGTLAYIAPEQTGRMNRGIDYRADFYSLGITLYELLTGQLPFQSDDPMELIHCHIAKTPVPPWELSPSFSIPQLLSDIILKLIAKNAEDRYQSALGLKHDLQQCLSQWETSEHIEAFDLGLRDVCDRFLISEKLYGRGAEVQALLGAFERVSQGTSELMLVSGFSGIGKTAVVNEVHKPIARKNGYFIKGKFDQFNRNIPFSAFVQAFRGFMGQLLSESDVALASWRTEIITAVGENGQVLTEVIPELEQIIGVQSVAPELSGIAAQNRFNLLFGKFIQVFTTPEHPLVIFLDDLQWADSASLNLLQVLMAESHTGYLLVLGAYRDNEVFPAHPLMLALNEMANLAAPIQTLTLSALSFAHVNHLVADTLHTSTSVAGPLTALVMQNTQGNPFFVNQFLKVLHEDRLISFDRDSGHWQCDIAQIQNAALTGDVLEFMVSQLQKLPLTTQGILKIAACIGAQFSLNTLAIVLQKSLTEVATDLWSALQAGLILPQSEIYKFYLDYQRTVYRKLFYYRSASTHSLRSS